MKDKNKALILMFVCIIVGILSPFLNFYLEQLAIEKGVEISFPGLIPWQFMMLFCGMGSFMGLIFYIHFDSKDKNNPKVIEDVE